MSYEKQNFVDGQVLTAAHLNHIEDGISALESQGGSGGSVSDEHINSLIDAKLGVIENGSY